MSLTENTASSRIDLLWVGEDGWCVCDAARSDDDPRRVIAFAQCHDGGVEVTWVRERKPLARFDTLCAALLSIEAACGRL